MQRGRARQQVRVEDVGVAEAAVVVVRLRAGRLGGRGPGRPPVAYFLQSPSAGARCRRCDGGGFWQRAWPRQRPWERQRTWARARTQRGLGGIASGFDGSGEIGVLGKRPASVYDAIEQGHFVAGKRQVKQRTMVHSSGDAVLLVDMNPPSYHNPHGSSSTASGAPAGPSGKALKFENCSLCQHCWDGGDLIMCDYCPVSMCFHCSGVDPNNLGPSWRCPHHACHGCGRKAHAAGGLLFRCAECSKAFCEDCLPRDSRVINESARFNALGFVCPKSACYVLCSEHCAALARSTRRAASEDCCVRWCGRRVVVESGRDERILVSRVWTVWCLEVDKEIAFGATPYNQPNNDERAAAPPATASRFFHAHTLPGGAKRPSLVSSAVSGTSA